MPTPERRPHRAWLRDPFLFAMTLATLAFVTIALAVTGRFFGDPALLGLAVVSVLPAFWLFYQRERAMATGRGDDRPRRR
ncbi:MAG: hypothetical protein IT305_00585 [Chloroflexi bacterium]|nr:hypothetical protein [Chloroflexota bacterium]